MEKMIMNIIREERLSSCFCSTQWLQSPNISGKFPKESECPNENILEVTL